MNKLRMARTILKTYHQKKHPSTYPAQKQAKEERTKGIAFATPRRGARPSTCSLEQGQVLLDGIRQLGEHRLAADLHLVIVNAHKNLCLERVRKDVRVALHLTA